jgi:DNA-binding beta-propeller fold protein YncE
VWAKNALYVADEPAGRVKVYDKDGRFLGQSNVVKSPVHLVAWKGSLYVSGGNEVLTAKLSKTPGNFTLSPIKGVKVKNGCGMAFTNSGHFYIASRTENVILKFDSDFKPMEFQCQLTDNPEFLLHV